MKRRTFLAATLAAPSIARAQASARVVIVGGGFGGATAARTLRRIAPAIDVTLVEANPTFTACPFSNLVLAGLRDMAAQRFGYARLSAEGVRVIHASAVGAEAGRLRLADGAALPYDRMILSPGIDFAWGALPGYDEAGSARMPHAWKAGAQTELLARQLAEMEDGGVVLISAPANPFRCPPGPYERASLIAHYLKTRKPRAKLMILDAKDAFSKQSLFQAAWKQLYPNLEWVGLSAGGKAIAVDPAALTVTTDFATQKGAVVNIIPPQHAGAIAAAVGVADRTGWCPVDPVTFESRLQPGLHVIGDAAIMGAMPKSAFAANAQAKVAAEAVAALLAGNAPAEPRLLNTCYSTVAPGYGITVAGVYRPANGVLADIPGAGGTTPADASAEAHGLEAAYAEAWFKTITNETFG
jgi:NADPH-dependent 2,4-dienoyl-CoA reductase/sulfur reductase-like enzyme